MMPDRMNIEWRNINRERDYPFSAGATRQPTTGIRIPTDAFLDAVFYPIDLDGELYLSSVDRMAGSMAVSDASGVRGTGELAGDVVTFFDDFMRPVGTMVLGPGFDSLSATTVATLEATRFAAACVFPQNQVGVRALLLPDGTIVTGDVTLAGEDGIRVDTSVEDGKTVIRIMAVGVQSTEDCIELPPPVKCLRIKQVAESTLTISQSVTSEGVVLGLGARLDIDDVCPSKGVPNEGGDLPLSHGDLCDEEPPQPEPDPPAPGFEGECPPSHNGRYFIIPLTDLLEVNPSDDPVALGTPLESASVDGFQDILDRLPPRQPQSIEIAVRGY
jgi:hypothetical protein